MLWFSNITLLQLTLFTWGHDKRGFPEFLLNLMNLSLNLMKSEINQSLTQGRVLPLSPTMTDKTEVSRFHVLFQVYWRYSDSRPRWSRV